jgi:hypothetical protein
MANINLNPLENISEEYLDFNLGPNDREFKREHAEAAVFQFLQENRNTTYYGRILLGQFQGYFTGWTDATFEMPRGKY